MSHPIPPESPSSVRVVLLGPDGEVLPQAPTPDSQDFRDTLRDTGHWLNEHMESAREFRASPGRRLGPPPDNDTRRGSGEEVVSPLAVEPDRAMAVAFDGAVFADPLDRLRVLADTCEWEVAHGSLGRLSWRASLRTGRVAQRAATLRLRPTPSHNLTVIELVPAHRPWFRTDAFVRAGVPAVIELCRRLRRGASLGGPASVDRDHGTVHHGTGV